MPHDGKRWFHIILSTRGSWLPGDVRGFRSRDHRIHSSGDYKHKPPAGEHEGLHAHHMQRSRGAVLIPAPLRPIIGTALLRKVIEQGHQILALSSGITHAHLQVELPNDLAEARQLAGTWKQASSHAIRNVLPGSVWAGGGKPIPIKDRPHHQNVFDYILGHVDEGAWVWSFRDPLPWEGVDET